MKINSKWSQEVGRWDVLFCDYIDRKVIQLPDKDLVMKIERKESGDILKFLGGPTGFESYNIKDLTALPLIGEDLCICGGTINKYPQCTVNMNDVKEFLKSKRYIK